MANCQRDRVSRYPCHSGGAVAALALDSVFMSPSGPAGSAAIIPTLPTHRPASPACPQGKP